MHYVTDYAFDKFSVDGGPTMTLRAYGRSGTQQYAPGTHPAATPRPASPATPHGHAHGEAGCGGVATEGVRPGGVTAEHGRYRGEAHGVAWPRRVPRQGASRGRHVPHVPASSRSPAHSTTPGGVCCGPGQPLCHSGCATPAALARGPGWGAPLAGRPAGSAAGT